MKHVPYLLITNGVITDEQADELMEFVNPDNDNPKVKEVMEYKNLTLAEKTILAALAPISGDLKINEIDNEYDI